PAARLPIAAVAVRALQVAGAMAYAFESDAVCEGIGHAREIRLDTLRERIEPGGSGHGWWNAQREIAVDDGKTWQHGVVPQAHLDAVLLGGEHRVLGDLRAGPGGRGNCD